jgi:hypothetical protein
VSDDVVRVEVVADVLVLMLLLVDVAGRCVRVLVDDVALGAILAPVVLDVPVVLVPGAVLDVGFRVAVEGARLGESEPDGTTDCLRGEEVLAVVFSESDCDGRTAWPAAVLLVVVTGGLRAVLDADAVGRVERAPPVVVEDIDDDNDDFWPAEEVEAPGRRGVLPTTAFLATGLSDAATSCDEAVDA